MVVVVVVLVVVVVVVVISCDMCYVVIHEDITRPCRSGYIDTKVAKSHLMRAIVLLETTVLRGMWSLLWRAWVMTFTSQRSHSYRDSEVTPRTETHHN